MSTVRNLSILSVAIALAVAVLVAPMAHAPLPSQTPSTTPQYFTCAEIIPGIPGSNPSHVIIWLRLSNVTTPNGLNYLLSQMYYNPASPYFHRVNKLHNPIPIRLMVLATELSGKLHN